MKVLIGTDLEGVAGVSALPIARIDLYPACNAGGGRTSLSVFLIPTGKCPRCTPHVIHARVTA